MDIVARQKKLNTLMSKIEMAQNWNRIAFLAAFGALIDACTCLATAKKLSVVDYVSVPAVVFTVKKAVTLSQKEDKALQTWYSLQQKSAHRV